MENLKQFNSKSQEHSSNKDSDLILQKEICQRTFKEVANFYNSKQEIFKTFESEFNVNIWFLNHFRTYMNYRNEELKNNSIDKNKISKFKILCRVIKDLFLIISKNTTKKKTQA